VSGAAVVDYDEFITTVILHYAEDCCGRPLGSLGISDYQLHKHTHTHN